MLARLPLILHKLNTIIDQENCDQQLRSVGGCHLCQQLLCRPVKFLCHQHVRQDFGHDRIASGAGANEAAPDSRVATHASRGYHSVTG